MHVQATASSFVQVKPPRLNFAGRCIYCGDFNCTEQKCAASYNLSRWIVCTQCEGLGDECCYAGVMETHPYISLPDNASASAPVPMNAPVSVPPAFVSVPLPRCLACGHRTEVAHADCHIAHESNWQPCVECSGRRMDADGFECRLCCGVGFFELSAKDTLAERAGEPWFC